MLFGRGIDSVQRMRLTLFLPFRLCCEPAYNYTNDH
uniref:Uncharacterized protein n=1 Tax=Rhizophora mucronata TaxID=61149 RepID=A0A2P2Q7U4_RHIMU